MGVCEGAPRTIMPDHLGRADYHGSSINQAARYMDAAAHGGMVRLAQLLGRGWSYLTEALSVMLVHFGWQLSRPGLAHAGRATALWCWPLAQQPAAVRCVYAVCASFTLPASPWRLPAALHDASWCPGSPSPALSLPVPCRCPSGGV
jgi:hypothetical protein